MDEGQQGTDAPVAPEATSAAPPEVQIASLRRRLVAYAFDAGLTVFPVAMLGTLFGLGSGNGSAAEVAWSVAPTAITPTSALVENAIVTLVGTALWLLLIGIVSARDGAWRGQTPGKRLAGLRAVRHDGTPMGAGQAWRRAALLGLTVGWLPFGVGPLLDALTERTPTFSMLTLALLSIVSIISVVAALRGTERRLLHDQLAGTVVVRTARRTKAVVIGPQGAQAVDAAPEASSSAAVAPQPRRRDAGTFVLGGLTLAVLVGWVVTAALWLGEQPPRDSLRRTFDAPGAAQARESLRTAQKAYSDCIADFPNLPEDCDSARELNLQRLVVRGDGADAPGKVSIRRGRRDADGFAAPPKLSSYSRSGQRWIVELNEIETPRRTCRLPSDRACPGMPPLGW